MLEKLEQYYEQELRLTRVGMEHETDLVRRSDIAWYATQRCLGAGQFAQMCGVKFEDVEPRFDTVRMELQLMVNEEI